MRFLFISGCNITPYNGATSAVHLATEVSNPASLDTTKLYHSEISPLGRRSVRLLDLQREDAQAIKAVRKEMDVLWKKFRELAVRDGIMVV